MAEILIEGRRLDVKEGLDFSFNYSVADVRDPSKRNTSYSKTIKCPATKDNDILFGNIWAVNISNPNDPTQTNIDVNFNPNKKAKAIVISDGGTVMEGVVQLRAVTITNGRYDYEVVFIGNLKDLFSALGDKRINDVEGVDTDGNGIIDTYNPLIDFSDLDHLLTRENQQDSWVAPIGEGYVYPYADYGDEQTFTLGGERTIPVVNLRPAVYAKDIWDRIFAYIRS